jgi:hypothetical protein
VLNLIESSSLQLLPIQPVSVGKDDNMQIRLQQYESFLAQQSQVLIERKTILDERKRLLERSQALMLHKQRLLEHTKALLHVINNPPSEEARMKLLEEHRLLLITHQTGMSIFEWLKSKEHNQPRSS